MLLESLCNDTVRRDPTWSLVKWQVDLDPFLTALKRNRGLVSVLFQFCWSGVL